jgi:hypothetical protein
MPYIQDMVYLKIQNLPAANGIIFIGPEPEVMDV